MNNMEIYNSSRVVPEEAKKKITGGRLNGFTDINPMWRIKKLTELFGPCGFGWYYEVTSNEIIVGGNEHAAFVSISLYIKIDGEWSKPIHGTGGSSFVAQQKSGPYMSDECFKMATTDALSVACKNLGIGADVYFEKDRTKYTATEEQPTRPAQQSKLAPVADPDEKRQKFKAACMKIEEAHPGHLLGQLEAWGLKGLEDVPEKRMEEFYKFLLTLAQPRKTV